MSRTLGETLSYYLTEHGLGQPDAEAWSEIVVTEVDGKATLTWSDWVPGQRDDGTPHTATLDMSVTAFMEQLWWS